MIRGVKFVSVPVRDQDAAIFEAAIVAHLPAEARESSNDLSVGEVVVEAQHRGSA